MKILHGWKDLSQGDRGSAVALGNFDGVHLGHQRVLADAERAASSLGSTWGAISFEPHARMHFQPDAPPFRLMKPSQLARTLDALGAQRLYLLPFGAEMAAFSDYEFVRQVLVGGLGVRHVAVGFDVTFGRGRTGDPESMKRYGEDFGFSVSVAPPMEAFGSKISSSAIREALRLGRPDLAATLLGRPFAIEGVVEKGRQLGRTLGFPTANIPLGDYVAPRLGVYATRTRIAGGPRLPGVANIGVNPTTGEVAARLEVWLFDFDRDIYGETIETELVAFLRPEERFDSIDDLVRRVHIDAERARAILAV
jgi:riboflavin kinase/FMN adenylyltransferase